VSYVLDALKKADAQRELERGAVPGLHAQPMPAAGAGAEQRAGGWQPWMWTAVGAGAVLVGAFAWRLWSPGEASVPVAQAPATVALPAAAPASIAAPAPAPAATPAPVPATPVAAIPAPQPATPPAAVARPVPSQPTPSRAAPEGEAARAVAPAPQVAAAPAATPTPAPATAPVVRPPAAGTRAQGATPPVAEAATHDAGQPEGRILSQRELPEEIRRELPPLVVGGSIYSESPANRFLILNGQVLHENDKLGPELTLEQIRLKLAVLRYKGYRFRITY
jgi:general secretion pathway protein B